MVRLESLTRPELIYFPLPAEDRDEVLRAFARRIAERGLVASAEELFQRLLEREGLGSTGVGSSVAIPHCKLKGLGRPLLSIGVVDRPGIDFAAADGKPVRLFFLVVSPSDSPAEHLQVLAAISRWVKTGSHAERILESKSAEEIYRLLRQDATA